MEFQKGRPPKVFRRDGHVFVKKKKMSCRYVFKECAPVKGGGGGGGPNRTLYILLWTITTNTVRLARTLNC